MSLRRLGGSRLSLLALIAFHGRKLVVLGGPGWRVGVVNIKNRLSVPHHRHCGIHQFRLYMGHC
jgi:hypothetical protein